MEMSYRVCLTYLEGLPPKEQVIRSNVQIDCLYLKYLGPEIVWISIFPLYLEIFEHVQQYILRTGSMFTFEIHLCFIYALYI